MTLNMSLQQYLSSYNSIEAQNQALEQLAAAHPYFAPAHFHLLANKKEGDPGYAELASRTALFFNDPLWLNFNLEELKKKQFPETEPPFNAPVETPEPAPPIPAIPEIETIENTASIDDPAETPEIHPMAPAFPETEQVPVLLKNILSQPATELSDDLPAFQPLYTSDYFASQGIKLSEQVDPADKLGKQLKSFTEWLKGMKKLHQEKPDELPGSQSASTIPDQAEKSNAEGEVLTEAMAEVFLLQGKPEKATEIYHKLSLLNPAKSAYFAAKIEQLKRT